jgi:hypothetical protein
MHTKRLFKMKKPFLNIPYIEIFATTHGLVLLRLLNLTWMARGVYNSQNFEEIQLKNGQK